MSKKFLGPRQMIGLVDKPTDLLTGVGAQRQKDLAKLGIDSIYSLLFHFPHRFEHYTLTDLSDAQQDSRVTVQGYLHGQPSIKWFNGNKSRLSWQIKVEDVLCYAVWFNQPYMKDKLSGVTNMILFSGKYDKNMRTIVVDRTLLGTWEQQEFLGKMEPIYPATAGIKPYMLRKHIQEALKKYGSEITEILPTYLLEKYRLLSRLDAISILHSPQNYEQVNQGLRRMIYEELFLHQLKLLLHKQKSRQELLGIAHNFERAALEKFITDLPFTLTDAQNRVIEEIVADLSSAKPMNRMLQGDVGSGKTLVAATALYANYLSGYQGALMVPTEILADQHQRSIERLLSNYGVRVALLTGNMQKSVKQEVVHGISKGEVDIVIGTHALIQEQVDYYKLGLVVIDEQHRFGVKQRARFRAKADMLDVLSMTATPIPRTLALSVAGDLDLSTIDELPANREPITTYWVNKSKWSKVLQIIEQECSLGYQAYVVCPLIQESEKLDLQNAEDLYKTLQKQLPTLSIGLLHGKMSSADKDEVMQKFISEQISVLVSTTVIEVGVDVPNATAMVIYDADRFGLSQLHQLRGRVGRGKAASVCILVANPKSQDGAYRMQVMTETTDGFEISRRDLALRGPGEFLGVKQSGVPMFKLADLQRDMRILEIAHNDAAQMLAQGMLDDALMQEIEAGSLGQELLE